MNTIAGLSDDFFNDHSDDEFGQKHASNSQSQTQQWDTSRQSGMKRVPEKFSSDEDVNDNTMVRRSFFEGLCMRVLEDHHASKKQGYALLEKYQGRESELFVKLCQKYHVHASYYMQIEAGIVLYDALISTS